MKNTELNQPQGLSQQEVELVNGAGRGGGIVVRPSPEPLTKDEVNSVIGGGSGGIVKDPRDPKRPDNNTMAQLSMDEIKLVNGGGSGGIDKDPRVNRVANSSQINT